MYTACMVPNMQVGMQGLHAYFNWMPACILHIYYLSVLLDMSPGKALPRRSCSAVASRCAIRSEPND